MLQIKTIRNRLDNPTLFDDEVNTALRDGWTLKKRTVLRPIGQSESAYGALHPPCSPWFRQEAPAEVL